MSVNHYSTEVVFQISSISNTGDSTAYILATIHFLSPKLGSFSDMEH